jgi:beta-lactamase class A
MKLLLACIFLFIYTFSAGQKTDKKLQKKLQQEINGFHGEIGIYVKSLKTGKIVAINADTIFPTASMVKVPILIGIMDKIQKDELKYNQELIYKDSLLYAGVDILGSFKTEEKIELGKLIMLMLTMSDNTASLWLQSLAGTGTRINAILDSLGFISTRVNSRTPGREENRSIYGWGQTTPREMATLLERIYKNEIISAAACERMQRSLSRNFWDSHAISQIPPFIQVFSKNGAVDESRSEALLINGKKTTYVFCFATKNLQDQSWKNDNEAWMLAKKISKILWEYFEPRDTWNPAPGYEKFY